VPPRLHCNPVARLNYPLAHLLDGISGYSLYSTYTLDFESRLYLSTS
jgi:hypothetical protein